jgi:hypothetical protein
MSAYIRSKIFFYQVFQGPEVHLVRNWPAPILAWAGGLNDRHHDGRAPKSPIEWGKRDQIDDDVRRNIASPIFPLYGPRTGNFCAGDPVCEQQASKKWRGLSAPPESELSLFLLNAVSADLPFNRSFC